MADVIIYTTRFCPFCVRAKQLLSKKKIAFKEIPVDNNPSLRQEMTKKAGGIHTVPQIWIGEIHVGGCSELMALDTAGDLDKLLQQ